MALLAVYALYVHVLGSVPRRIRLNRILLSLTNILLIFAVLFLVGGFAAINRFGTSLLPIAFQSTRPYPDLSPSIHPLNLPLPTHQSPLPSHTPFRRRCRRVIHPPPAPDPIQVGEHVITQKSLYTGLFVIGIPLLWFSSPFSTFFWLVGASAVLILGHATIMEPGIESEYAQVQDSV